MTLHVIKQNGVPSHVQLRDGDTVVDINMSHFDGAMVDLLDTRAALIRADKADARGSKKRIIAGRLEFRDDGDAGGILHVGDDPVAEAFSAYGEVTVHYWVTSMPKSKAELSMDTFKKMHGDCDQKYYHRYSDYTGYLWTEEGLVVGGHDLLAELRGEKGKYLYAEMETHR